MSSGASDRLHTECSHEYRNPNNYRLRFLKTTRWTNRWELVTLPRLARYELSCRYRICAYESPRQHRLRRDEVSALFERNDLPNLGKLGRSSGRRLYTRELNSMSVSGAQSFTAFLESDLRDQLMPFSLLRDFTHLRSRRTDAPPSGRRTLNIPPLPSPLGLAVQKLESADDILAKVLEKV